MFEKYEFYISLLLSAKGLKEKLNKIILHLLNLWVITKCRNVQDGVTAFLVCPFTAKV